MPLVKAKGKGIGPAPSIAQGLARAALRSEPLAAPRYMPLMEPDLADDPPPAPALADRLGEERRRALQSALFELTECRRTIERIIAGRDR